MRRLDIHSRQAIDEAMLETHSHPNTVRGDNQRTGGQADQSLPDQAPALGFDPTAWQFIADPVWVFDVDYDHIVWANPAALSFWNAGSLQELQARDFSTNSDVAKARLADHADRIQNGESIESYWTFYPKGEAKKALCRASGVPLSGGRKGLMGHIIAPIESGAGGQCKQDQTENLRDARGQLAQAEARFRAFAEAGSDWLWETDDRHRFTYFSASVQKHFATPFRKMLGLTRHEAIAKIGADPDTTETREKWDRHAEDLAAHRPFRDLQYAVRSENGEIRYSAISGDPIFTESGKFIGYRGVARNVSTTIKAELHARALERERDLAITAKTVMDRFLATMSHELRTPLNAIIGFSELMSKEAFGPLGGKTYRDYASDILGSAQHLLSIVEDLLGLSRFDLADQPLELETVTAQSLSNDILAIAQGIGLQRGITLEQDIPAPSFTFAIDRRGIKQVALNLLSNAIKFSPPTEKVTLRIAPHAEGVEIVVRDSGPGIPSDLLETIFEPLQMVDPHRAGSGAGLGLWITKRIVTAHEGTISLESTVGEGTTVYVRLPSRNADQEAPNRAD